MTLSFHERPWRISYSSNENNPIAEFYIPALECAIQYDRRSGYFSSAILARIARGLGAMLHQEGKIRLLMGCQFSPQDLAAIRQGYELKSAMGDRLFQSLDTPENFLQLKHLEILSWLIANDYLDIKIAIPLNHQGFPLGDELDTRHIFHEKVGIFTDNKGDCLVFSGSNNESISGWEQNIESFHVYCSWLGDRELERVLEEQFRFEQLWNNLAPNVAVFDVPEAVRQKLVKYAPINKPTWNRQSDLSPAIYRVEPLPEPFPTIDLEREREAFSRLANLKDHPGCLDYCLKSIPITPWPHQIKILRRVARQFPCNYLIADEVGLGKTIEMGLVLKYLIVSQKVRRVLLLVPASVQFQWQEELKEKFNLHFWSYSQGVFKNSDRETCTPLPNLWDTQDLILASSHLVRRSDRSLDLLAAQNWDLVIVDEAHHARRSSPEQRKDTPNRLLFLLRLLKEKTQSLILLTATPMQVDSIEVHDLLSLLGLKGDWRFPEMFCDYFDSLFHSPNGQLLEFWQRLSTDYFNNGGEPCRWLERHLMESDRLLYYQLKDIWQCGQRLINPKQYITNTKFLTASRQYLTVNTPLKDLMFRHTRDTLREYYKRGLLAKDIPQREVSDYFIPLEPEREVPLYQAVSEYVRHFYNLAQQENRKALGFLMTLYRRRLTSSLYAIRQSLQRRLDGISFTDDDFIDLDEANDAVIEGLEFYFQPTDPEEIDYLENLLRQFTNTGEDSKLAYFLNILRQELELRESALVFTQYTDTMDYLRDTLAALYGSQVACYSGRGGERYQLGRWEIVPKEQVKRSFTEGTIKILLCTESANEGLNLQTCGVLLNWDLPWVPSRIEQRIGRIDRIGQVYPTVRIHNFYYDGTVEAKVYRRLRQRIDAFESVVGNLQPILAQVPTLIERAVMAADPKEEGVLLTQFDEFITNVPDRPLLDDMVAKDVEADLAEIRQPIPVTPMTSEEIEQLFTTSELLKLRGYSFTAIGDRLWQLSYKQKTYQVTFYPEIFEGDRVRLLGFGEPLFSLMIGECSTLHL